jgi:elongation factor G
VRVAGVQSQSITVDRQMRRYNVPRLAFINKLRPPGREPVPRPRPAAREARLNAHLVQIPIGLEDKLEGLVDLVEMRAYTFTATTARSSRRSPIPTTEEQAAQHRESCSTPSRCSTTRDGSDARGERHDELIHAAIRKATIANKLVPVFCGSAYKNKGVQLLLDGVQAYLPDPTEVENTRVDLDNGGRSRGPCRSRRTARRPRLQARGRPLRPADLHRVYQGTLAKDSFITTAPKQKIKVGRLVRMHSDEMEDIESTTSGDIVACSVWSAIRATRSPTAPSNCR